MVKFTKKLLLLDPKQTRDICIIDIKLKPKRMEPPSETDVAGVCDGGTFSNLAADWLVAVLPNNQKPV